MSDNNLQRMIIIPPDIFNKWKHIITEDQKLSELDKSMKKILYNTNINDINKWHQYRENLLKYTFSKKRDLKLNHLLKPITADKSQQTNVISNSNVEQQTKWIFKKDQNIQTENYTLDKETYTDKNDLFQNDDEVFENDIQLENNILDGDVDGEEEFDLKKKVLEGYPPNIKIYKERKSHDPLLYRTFELTNGDVVNIPTKRTTRGMLKSNDGTSTNSKKLKQSQIPFKKSKGPSSQKFRTKLPKIHESQPSKSESDVFSWDNYE